MKIVEEGFSVFDVSELLSLYMMLPPDAVLPVHSLGEKSILPMMVLGAGEENLLSLLKINLIPAILICFYIGERRLGVLP